MAGLVQRSASACVSSARWLPATFFGPTMAISSRRFRRQHSSAQEARDEVSDQSLYAQMPSKATTHTSPDTSQMRYIPSQPSEPITGPRWEKTPPRLKAPYSFKNEVVGRRYLVNDDPKRLDNAYAEVFGAGAERLLTDETKWLAVTHKSFDHGKRGFNDRLSYLGKRVLTLQATLSSVHQLPMRRSSASTTQSSTSRNSSGQEPFRHAAFDGLPNLIYRPTENLLSVHFMSKLARHRGLAEVIRWKPKLATRMNASGLSLVCAQALYAMIGALDLEQGGKVTNDLIRERILPFLLKQYRGEPL